MKLFYRLLIPGLALALAACTDEEEIEGNGHGLDEAVFSLEKVSVDNTTATVKASATGNKDATYYCFETSDLTSKPEKVVSDHLKTISVTRHILSTGTTTHVAEGLRPGGKKYRFIMTGLLANGVAYNEPVVLDFETTGDFAKQNWQLAYPNPNDQPTMVSISGVPTDYVYGFMTKEAWAATDIKTIVNETLDGGKYKVSEGDEKVNLPISETGDYVLYVFGVDGNDFPTLDYAAFEFTITKIDYSAYQAFLGTWYDAAGQKFIIAQKELGATYTVKGLDADFVAAYEANTIKFYFTGTDSQDTASGLPVYIFGLDQDGYVEDASQNDAEQYLLATGKVTKSGIAITGQNYNAVYSGTTYNEQIVALQALAYDEASDKVVQIGKKITLALPVTLVSTKPDDPNPGEVSYDDYLGNWTVVRGSETDTWTISQKEAGKTYTIVGIESVEIDVEAAYDSAAKTLVIYDQILETFNDSQLGPMQASLHGKILYQGSYYYVTSGDDPYVISTGTLSSDKKSIALDQGKVSIQDIGELDLVGLQLFAEVLEGANKGKVYGFSSDFTALPNTLTSAAPTSAPSSCGRQFAPCAEAGMISAAIGSTVVFRPNSR